MACLVSAAVLIGQVLVVLRGPGPAVAATAVDHASASACGTKRVRPLSSTSLADRARLGCPALSGCVAGRGRKPRKRESYGRVAPYGFSSTSRHTRF